MSTSWVTLASIGTICTGFDMPISSGPIAVPLVSRGHRLGQDMRGMQAGHHQHIGRPVSRQNG